MSTGLITKEFMPALVTKAHPNLGNRSFDFLSIKVLPFQAANVAVIKILAFFFITCTSCWHKRIPAVLRVYLSTAGIVVL